MRMLPGIAERDLDQFGTSVNTIQELGFKKIELSFQPREMTGLLNAMRAPGRRGGHEFVWPDPVCRQRYGDAGYRTGSAIVHAGGRGWIHACHCCTQQRRSGKDCVKFLGHEVSEHTGNGGPDTLGIPYFPIATSISSNEGYRDSIRSTRPPASVMAAEHALSGHIPGIAGKVPVLFPVRYSRSMRAGSAAENQIMYMIEPNCPRSSFMVPDATTGNAGGSLHGRRSPRPGTGYQPTTQSWP